MTGPFSVTTVATCAMSSARGMSSVLPVALMNHLAQVAATVATEAGVQCRVGTAFQIVQIPHLGNTADRAAIHDARLGRE